MRPTRDTNTSSGFYQTMRQAYAAPATTDSSRRGGDVATIQQQGPYINDIQKRLQSLLGPQVARPAMSGPNPNVHPTPSGIAGFTPVSQQQPQQQFVPPTFQQQQQQQQQQVLPNSIPAVQDDEELLLPAEVECLRVVELEAKVSVLADLRTTADASPPQLTLICDDATVKIFPQHIVLSRPSGAPVVELVILELHELTEDDARNALDFVLKKPDGSVTVVEVQCASAVARSAIYKLVCSKRNLLEKGGPR